MELIRTRRPTISTLESAIRSDTISHLSYIAIRLGRAIQWDPETERIVDDRQATERMDRPMRAPWTM